MEGEPTKASWPGRWRREPAPGQGSGLPTDPCPLCTGSRKKGRTERGSSEAAGARTHLHTHITCTYTKCTHMHIDMCAHTQVLQGPDFQFQDPHPWLPLFLSC